MEHKIGEIVTLSDGRKAEVLETKYLCSHCMFVSNSSCHTRRRAGELGWCFGGLRTDNKNIIYREIKED